jgi:hypothetical protein
MAGFSAATAIAKSMCILHFLPCIDCIEELVSKRSSPSGQSVKQLNITNKLWRVLPNHKIFKHNFKSNIFNEICLNSIYFGLFNYQ